MTKILLVEDDLVVSSTMCTGLRRYGYEAIKVEEASAALAMCQTDPPDLAVIDIKMPGMSGIDLARILKATTQVPFIFLTAFDDAATVSLAIEAGALGYLVKPIEASRLIPSIETALARAEENEKVAENLAQVTHALKRNQEIDVAVGLLMGRHLINRARAFETLRSYARSHCRKIVDVAAEIIAGEVIDLSSYLK